MNVTVKQLEEAFAESIAMLSARTDAFPWEDRAVYTWWIAQTYYLVRHTTRLICLCAGQCGLEDDELHQKSVWHLKEEVGHEQMAIADLRALGGSPEKYPELPETCAIYQSQYFFVEHYGPYSQLGYSMMLEGLAAAKGHEITKTLIDAHGPRATRFIKCHAEEDQGHVEAGLAFLARIDGDKRASILRNLEQSRHLYINMLNAVEKVAGEIIRHSSAA